MVPSLTASGYPVSWKWRRAWLFPPEPSKYLRPHSTFPSVRFIQIFSWRSHTSHRQPLGCREDTTAFTDWSNDGLMDPICTSATQWGSLVCRDSCRIYSFAHSFFNLGQNRRETLLVKSLIYDKVNGRFIYRTAVTWCLTWEGSWLRCRAV